MKGTKKNSKKKGRDTGGKMEKKQRDAGVEREEGEIVVVKAVIGLI